MHECPSVISTAVALLPKIEAVSKTVAVTAFLLLNPDERRVYLLIVEILQLFCLLVSVFQKKLDTFPPCFYQFIEALVKV